MRDTISGLKFVYEPKHLRFFQAKFEPVRLSAALSMSNQKASVLSAGSMRR
jgi:hypothetical protein